MPSRFRASRCVVSSVGSSRRLVLLVRLVWAPFRPAVRSLSSCLSWRDFLASPYRLVSLSVSSLRPVIASRRFGSFLIVSFSLVVLLCLIRWRFVSVLVSVPVFAPFCFARCSFLTHSVRLRSSPFVSAHPSRFPSPSWGVGSGVMAMGRRWIALCVSSVLLSFLFAIRSLWGMRADCDMGRRFVLFAARRLVPRCSCPHRFLSSHPSPHFTHSLRVVPSSTKQENDGRRRKRMRNRTRRPTRRKTRRGGGGGGDDTENKQATRRTTRRDTRNARTRRPLMRTDDNEGQLCPCRF